MSDETEFSDDGCWVAYYPDMSGVYVFATEIDALRKGVADHAMVKFVPWGGSV